MMILYSAPLPPDDGTNQGSPGAMRKISLTIQILKHLGHSVILLDSSHLTNATSIFVQTSITERKIGSHCVKVITPTTIWNRKLGKVFQAINAPDYGELAQTISKIDLVLIYNAYLFEVRLAKAMLHRKGIPFVLQLEDLPWSRRRGLFNIKANIEKVQFFNACRDASLILTVNTTVQLLTQEYNQNVELYPPIIDPQLMKLACIRQPPFTNKSIKIGYFGGLNTEKGADKILELAHSLESPYEVHVTGKGDLAAGFSALGKSDPDRLIFHGFVSGEELNALLCEMDIMVNPHTDLLALDEGVFPFKLFEYIASGAYVITTHLPEAETAKLEGLCYFDGSTVELLKCVTEAPLVYRHEFQQEVQTSAIDMAGFEQVCKRVNAAIERIKI